jgi:hypothetical protein
MSKIARHIKTYLLIEAIAVPVVLLFLTPHWPKTVLGWMLVILIWPPLWLLGEFFLSWVGEMSPYDSVTSIVFGVVFLLLLVGVYILFSMLLGDFLRPHFY